MEWNGGKIVKGLESGKERAGRGLMGRGQNHLGTDLHLPNYSQPAGGEGGIQGERTDGFQPNGFQQRVRGNQSPVRGRVPDRRIFFFNYSSLNWGLDFFLVNNVRTNRLEIKSEIKIFAYVNVNMNQTWSSFKIM